MIDFNERMANYSEDHCWQYDIRLNNLREDMAADGISEEEMHQMKVSDFEFKCVTDTTERNNMRAFIERHEWLGTISQYTTHWFGAYYKGSKLAGVILMGMPNAFSKIVGEETKDIERLISRGACISWSPKTLASALLMWSIRYMVNNSQYRVFTAYSDPSAKELGTIYQACNFLYIGQKSGAVDRYINPYTGKLVSDRFFRQKTAYKKYAKELGIEWQKNWNHPTGMSWENIPDEIEAQLRAYSKKKQSEAKRISTPAKHKYVYIKGKDKRETKLLLSKLRVKTYPYPKSR